jgi:hypothetical protein
MLELANLTEAKWQDGWCGHSLEFVTANRSRCDDKSTVRHEKNIFEMMK